MSGAFVHLSLPVRDDFLAVRAALARAGVGPFAGELFAALNTSGAGSVHCAVLATCERVEVFAASAQPIPGIERCATQTLRLVTGTQLSPSWRRIEGEPVLRHTLRLAAGLESRIVGESDILCQVRDTLAQAQRDKTSGPSIERLLSVAIKTGRLVRAKTELGRHDLGAAAAAVHALLAEPTRHVALLGSGAVAQACVRHLMTSAPLTRITLYARHTETARQRLPESIGVRPLQTLRHALAQELEPDRIDALISATSSPQFLLTPDSLVHRSAAVRLVDLGMPPNIHPGVGNVPGFVLRTLWNLPIDRGPAERSLAAAEEIVELNARALARWFESRHAAASLIAKSGGAR